MRQPKVEHPPRPDYVAKDGAKLKRERGKIWSYVRNKWLVETPEEYVRQQYLLVLLHEYDYGLGAIAEEEEVTGRGSGKARADFVIWRSAQDKAEQKSPSSSSNVNPIMSRSERRTTRKGTTTPA